MIVKEDFLNNLRRFFSLNLYEVRIWTALLSRGVSTAGELSDIGNVPRSRAYDVLESLEKKGFIIMKLGKPIKYVAVEPLEVVERVNRAFQNFFRRVKNGDKPGYPRFKSFGRYDSLTLKQAGWKLIDKDLQINKIGSFKLFLSRPIEGDIKSVTIRKTSSGRWYATFSCDNVPSKPLPKTGKTIGIDVGCESFLTTSEGEKVDNPRFFQRTNKLLIKRQKSVSRKKKGSKRRNKARILLSKTHEKVYNQRRDFHFKIARKLLQSYDIVCIEDMNHFKSYRSLNRSMRDVAWFGFFNILLFKAEEAGKEVIKVPTKNTSQACSECGKIVPRTLSDRVHSCPHCGLSIDRDINAACNILRLGQSLQGAGTLVPAMN